MVHIGQFGTITFVTAALFLIGGILAPQFPLPPPVLRYFQWAYKASPHQAAHEAPELLSKSEPKYHSTTQVVGETDLHSANVDGSSHVLSGVRQVSRLLPDEDTMAHLLQPIEERGPAKLKDVAQRTRQYKSYLEAWENLHLVQFDADIYLQKNVVQTLRQFEPTVPQAELSHLIHSYDEYRYFVNHLGTFLFPWTMPYISDHMTLHSQFYKRSRGIVFTAGNVQMAHLCASIRTLRALNCSLPVEVMFFGDEDLSLENRQRLERLPHVITRDLSFMVKNTDFGLGGWALKPYTLLMASFREVILMDADAFFLRDPRVLFDHPSYVKTGALFFADRLMSSRSQMRNLTSWLLEMMPEPLSPQLQQNRFWTGQAHHVQESGVVVVDKWRHIIALLLTARLNGEEREEIYQVLHGDKETYWLGWELAGDTEYAFHDGKVGVMGSITGGEGDDDDHKNAGKGEQNRGRSMCASQLAHLDTDGRPLWFNGGLRAIGELNAPHEPAKFEAFLMEPRGGLPSGGWTNTFGHCCCLTSDSASLFNFDEVEADTLALVMTIAKEEGVF